MNNLDVLQAVADLLDPEGDYVSPYAYFLEAEELLLAGILDAYNSVKPDRLLAHLVLAALHAAPEGTPLVYQYGDVRLDCHVAQQEIAFSGHWQNLSFFSVIDSGARLAFNLKERM